MKQSKPLPGIVICILMDLAGYASFSIPILGEFADIIWAPVSGYLFYKMFGGRFGITGGVLNFIEEALPFTDFIPSFTIAWLIRYFSAEKTSPQQQKLANAR
ncbi:MAG: hypothetical protein ABIO04_07610 [Ferruginibacter sp.]